MKYIDLTGNTTKLEVEVGEGVVQLTCSHTEQLDRNSMIAKMKQQEKIFSA
jgi:hypothetical protein